MVGLWLSRHSNVQLDVWSRSGRSPEATADALESQSMFTARRCDAAAAEDVHHALTPSEWRGSGHALSFLHAGGVLRDSLLLKQSASSIRTVFAPKLGGLGTAGRLLAALPVSQASAFSSISALIGSPGQSNYAAANAAMGAWAERVELMGLPGAFWNSCCDQSMRTQQLKCHYPSICVRRRCFSSMGGLGLGGHGWPERLSGGTGREVWGRVARSAGRSPGAAACP